jgi:hypothetical protein
MTQIQKDVLKASDGTKMNEGSLELRKISVVRDVVRNSLSDEIGL